MDYCDHWVIDCGSGVIRVTEYVAETLSQALRKGELEPWFWVEDIFGAKSLVCKSKIVYITENKMEQEKSAAVWHEKRHAATDLNDWGTPN